MTNQPTDQSVTLDQAAAVLGVSREAVRLRIRRGTLIGKKHADGWRVWLESPHLVGRSVGAPTDDQPATDRPKRPGRQPRIDPQIARMEKTIAVLEVELEARRREVAELHVLLQQQRQLPSPAFDNAPPARQEPAQPAPTSIRDVLATVRRWLRSR